MSDTGAMWLGGGLIVAMLLYVAATVWMRATLREHSRLLRRYLEARDEQR